jgi:aminoglycoside phosphotransferase (APT) family kinase protein
MLLGRLIGSGKEAEVFGAGADVLKLYRMGVGRETVDREAGILDALAPLPLPMPRSRGVVEIHGRWGILMSRADGPPLSAGLQLGDLGPVADGVAQLHRLVHAQPGGSLASCKARLARNIGMATELDEAERRRLLQRLAELPDGDRLCHGDFHPANIMGSLERPIIVDWPDATCGPPAADACRTYLLLLHNLPDMAEPYIEAYMRHSGIVRPQVLDWLPVLAAARLSENAPAETDRLLALARGARAS